MRVCVCVHACVCVCVYETADQHRFSSIVHADSCMTTNIYIKEKLMYCDSVAESVVLVTAAERLRQ